MEFRVKDAEGFRLIIQNIARFIRRANIEASHSGIRIRSIDPHDFW